MLACARKIAGKLKAMAADEFKCSAEDIELVSGAARVKGQPERAMSVGRLASRVHWNPANAPSGSP